MMRAAQPKFFMRELSKRKKTEFLASLGLSGKLVAIFAFLVLAGCGSRRAEFIAGRALEKCDSQWPVCDTISGCLVGDTSYVEGKFPSTGRVAVQVFEPSTVRAYLYLEDVSAAGEETAISFFEERCRARIRTALTGKAFIGEAEKVGYVVREAELVGEGDHLIEFESDATASYLLKLEVLPKRLQTN